MRVSGRGAHFWLSLIAGAYAAFVVHYSVNVPYFDQWSDFNVISHYYSHSLTLSTLWTQHNENRMLFPNLIVVGLTPTTHFNIVVEQYLSALLLFGATTLVVLTHRRYRPDLPWFAYLPVVLVMLCVTQYENALWGFQIAWYLILFCLAVTVWALGRDQPSRAMVILAMAAGVVGSYSSLQGLLIWVCALVLLRGKPRTMITVWVGVAVVTTAVYFIDYQRALGAWGTP